MIINCENPDTGEEFQVEANGVDSEFVNSMSVFGISDNEVKRLIDNLNISADAKSLLYTFSKATIRAGEFIIKIGRKIIDYVCLLCREYPNAIFGMIFGVIVGFLISSIPILGVVLGPLFAPITIALGLIGGTKEDLKNNELERNIVEINAKFSPLNT